MCDLYAYSVKMVNKLFYNTVLCQCFSNCGRYLIAGNLYGDVSIFDLGKVVNPQDTPVAEIQKPSITYTASPNLPIWSLVTTDKFLVVGTVNEISGWNFKSVISSNTYKPSWTIKISSNRDNLNVDVNCLWYDAKHERIVAGCGDNTIHIYKLDTGVLVRKLDGHNDYVHWVHGDGSQIVSASEDGTVKLWDMQQNSFTNELTPYKQEKLSRPDIGKWMGSVTINQDWLLCGGGPRLSLWHLRSFDISTVFDLPDCGIHVTGFIDDHVLAAGGSGHVYQLSYDGALMSDIATTPSAVYSVIHRNSPSKIMSIAGSSNNMDLCTNFNYRDQVLAFL